MISVVYTGDVNATKEEIIAKVKVRFRSFLKHDESHRRLQSHFDIVLDGKSLHFVFLNSRYLVEDSMWPRATLLGQSLGSMYLGWEAMTKMIPDIYIGTPFPCQSNVRC